MWLIRHPVVLTAVDPRHAFSFFREHGWHGFAVLGAVFLVVTGGEALYADMGHFGKRPIRIAWFALVLPALLLNYFGQGALLLHEPGSGGAAVLSARAGWALLPLVALATAAAIIASQALISGAFSLTQQAIQLGYCPRLDIEHTSHHEMGQVYVPQVNWALMVSTIVDRHRIRIVDRAGRRVRHRRDADDGHHGGAAAGRRHRALGLAACGGLYGDRACF